MTERLLEVEGLTIDFPTSGGTVRAVRDVSLSVSPGEIVGVVGESGSGKSVLTRALMGLVRPPGAVRGGHVWYGERDLLSLSDREKRSLRGRDIALITQDPLNALNPVMTIGAQLVEAVRLHRSLTRAAAAVEVREILSEVGIPDPAARFNDYPHQFSGGMRQRVLIAAGLINRPRVLLADEPTTALDVTVQAQVLDLMAEINRNRGSAVVLVTHNMGVAARLCQRIVVMYAGSVVEQGTVAKIFHSPEHPYTRGLLACVPRLDSPKSLELQPVPGVSRAVSAEHVGCGFADRCPYCDDDCRRRGPTLAGGASHSVACWHVDKVLAGPAEERTTRGPKTSFGVGDVPAPARSLTEREGRLSGRDVVEVRGLVVDFPIGKGRHRKTLRAVDGVTLSLPPGRTVGIVGESGSGKSTLARALMGITNATSGTISVHGAELTPGSSRARRQIRDAVQIIFQDPAGSLDPRMTIEQIIAEPLRARRQPREAQRRRVRELLSSVGLDPTLAHRYPREFSGGQRQRVGIARALAVAPRIVICDEAVSALDVSLQAQIINLLKRLQADTGVGYLFIGHDIAVVRHVSDDIVVMYLGTVVESGPADAVCAHPLHPYTASLISAVPIPDPEIESRRARIVLSGDVPSPAEPPPGCPFHTRCPIGPVHREGREICRTDRPQLRAVQGDRRAACHFAGELAAGADVTERRAWATEAERSAGPA